MKFAFAYMLFRKMKILKNRFKRVLFAQYDEKFSQKCIDSMKDLL